MRGWLRFIGFSLVVLTLSTASAEVGDPQVGTDHPWYPGELSCSTFDRLFATQARLYQRVVGRQPVSEQDRVLAAWLWRNTHYWHGEPGGEDLWAVGFEQAEPTREYWRGLFAYGFALCGTTHAQWTPEINALLGHNRARCVGTTGHNAFEVFLTGGAYGAGRWVLLDHDLSTVIFDERGERLISIAELLQDPKLARREFRPQRQQGWLIAGLHSDDIRSYNSFQTVEYLAGYAGPPPIVHLRRGERLRRYLEPGLDDGKTFVFWGRNYNVGGIPGPERSRTWVNQPNAMHDAREEAPYREGQARYANAVYVYEPDFRSEDYREGVVLENEHSVVFDFRTPYVIGATPPNHEPWGIYASGCRNGLLVEGQGRCEVALSLDGGRTWTPTGRLDGTLDLTDLAKGHQQYWLRLGAGRQELALSGLKITTVCQANSSVLPRLSDQGSRVTFEASGKAVVSAGPFAAQAAVHLIEGAWGDSRLSMQLATPRGERVKQVIAAAHVRSSNPPDPQVVYRIECSLDGGGTWNELVGDWKITRRGDEPSDFWSQSFCWGGEELKTDHSGPVLVRFSNSGGKSYARTELHLVYDVEQQDPTEVTFCWSDHAGEHTASWVVPADLATEHHWTIPTGENTRTRWVEFRPHNP